MRKSVLYIYLWYRYNPISEYQNEILFLMTIMLLSVDHQYARGSFFQFNEKTHFTFHIVLETTCYLLCTYIYQIKYCLSLPDNTQNKT
jgi:hypothetical protein